MKKYFFAVSLAAAFALAGTAAFAQPAAPAIPPVPQAAVTPAASQPPSELESLIQQIQGKLKAGKNTEADFSDELNRFDALLAKHAGEKNDDTAQIAFMKAMLYLEVFNDTDKGGALVQQIKKDFPDTKAGKNADKILDAIAKQNAAKKIQAQLVPGSIFPDFNEKDLNGQPLSVAALRGKVVLLDFWATWCPPCRAELPNVIAAYKKFHAAGLEIIGISLDGNRARLEAFLKKQDGMTWSQFFESTGDAPQNWSNKLASKYGVESIPFTILIGRDGKIIGTDLRGEALSAAVEKALETK